VQVGNWKYYDSTGKVDIEGEFDQGMRTGQWKYNQGEQQYVIDWVKYESSQGLVFNYPSHLALIDSISSGSRLCFSHGEDDLLQIEIFGNKGKDSILSVFRNLIYTSYKIIWSDCESIEDGISQYYYLRLYIEGNGFSGFMYTFISEWNGKAVIVEYLYPNKDLAFYNSIFSGVIDHLKIDNHTLVDPIRSVTVVPLDNWKCENKESE
jgi:hypothetical protein